VLDPVEMWPVFGIRVRTPRLTLRPVDPTNVFDVVALAGAGVHDPAFMPFTVPWTDEPQPAQRHNSLRHLFRAWAEFRPERWQLSLAVYEADVLVGVQGIQAAQFPVLRQFLTGSWLGRAHQGRGIGKEMRAAVLHLGFAGLGAVRADTDAFADNGPSLGVTRSLGYAPNGAVWDVRRGEPAEHLLFTMDRAHWETIRRDDIELDGVDDRLRSFLGLG
jgi:RimJ/RimL family protein N-acetyltransferase